MRMLGYLLWISVFTLTFGLPAHSLAQTRLLVMSWNVESGDNEAATIAQHLEDFEGYDLFGLTEVNQANAVTYADAAKVGEGAKNSTNPNFRHVMSDTGSGDRMVIIWDNKRLEKIGNPQELHDLNDPNRNHRSPFVARFKLRGTNTEFLFMVNHLARGNADLRQRQATGLKTWAEQQTLPVIAVGDYNFDYSIDEGQGNPAMENMLEGDVWKWVRPPRLSQTQFSSRFHSVLDFIFIANKPDAWDVESTILTQGFPPMDNDQRSDHRPVEAHILIR